MDLRPGRGGCAQHRKFYEGLADELAQAARFAVNTPTFDLSLSPAAEHLWQWFCDLHQGRQEGMGGPLPLGWTDMAHWAAMTATRVRPQEWRILRHVDVAYLAACREASVREQEASQSPHVHSERPMTAELFDALF